MLLSPAADGKSRHPGPLEELDFWEQKAADVNGIFDQLQSAGVRKILRYLDRNKCVLSIGHIFVCRVRFAARLL